ncbi:hypothetical protein FA95DRAFT_851702 [Auriscalpium vulgare]|uniref:Uncharacterized protein n=1 Tax=Auriscalpium vulgare TaxID=40419 RepID=A0ACB8R9Q7_9AGAM|nr:hypothetical protein FA95DRAFT_851702 [Auriscalpium vulgare]
MFRNPPRPTPAPFPLKPPRYCARLTPSLAAPNPPRRNTPTKRRVRPSRHSMIAWITTAFQIKGASMLSLSSALNHTVRQVFVPVKADFPTGYDLRRCPPNRGFHCQCLERISKTSRLAYARNHIDASEFNVQVLGAISLQSAPAEMVATTRRWWHYAKVSSLSVTGDNFTSI